MRVLAGILFLFFAQFTAWAGSSVVSVRVFSTNVIRNFIYSPLEGRYQVYGDGKKIAECDASAIFQMNIENDSVQLKTLEEDFGKFAKIKFVKKTTQASFKIKCILPASVVRTYEDDFEVTVNFDKSQLLLLNKVEIEKYIAGVVQSESGKSNNLEYYKLQALLCRTYLLAHLNRHAAEGFEVCDDVHCQAYLSRSTEKKVIEAVLATKNLVVVDQDLNMITAAFHSNCGGVTCNSEDVWSLRTSYLRSVKDTFCVNKVHSHWERTISYSDWNAYLKAKGKKVTDTTDNSLGLPIFYQEYGRATYYVDGAFKLPLKVIRADFKLKSTYFSIERKGENVVFKGRGYGHGVGLCQEGAMEMSKHNYTYLDILHHYYRDVNVIDLSSLAYFKQE